MSSFYVTTPIYYVNDHPHIGHIYTTLVADTVARYRRLRGDDVYFLTGTDEHGQKIERAAEERGVRPIDLADEVVARYHDIWSRLDVSHDDFIRTTEPRHAAGVRAIIERIAAAGDFYVDRHEGLYCVRCETYYTEKELLEGGCCPVHETPVEERSEENVFFRLSKYQQPLLDLYASHPEFVRPETRLNEVRQFVAQGLRDLSVSRSSVQWAIDFPEHDGQTVYVWLDALTNYISALGFGSDEGREDGHLYRDRWAADDATVVHFIGKDILRFHAVYWPAFLLSAGLPLPDTVWTHGWWLLDEHKISKSTGYVYRPDHLIERFGGDPLRFFLLREMAFGQDASISDEAFVERYNSDLANDLGNTVSRLVTLSRRAFDGLPPDADPDNELRPIAEEAVEGYRRHMDAFAFHQALDALWRLQQEMSQYLVRQEPWKKLKDESAKGEVSKVLWSCMEATRIVTTGLLPVLPEIAPKVLRALGALGQDDDPPATLDALAWGGLPAGGPLPAVEPLFPRIDKDAYLAELASAQQETAVSDARDTTPKPETTEAETTEAAQSTDSSEAAPQEPAPEPDPKITIDQFFETFLRVATIREAEKVKKSNKLVKLTVDVGEPEPRTVVAGIAKQYAPEDLVGRQVVVVANLQPAKLMGIESNGMVLAASVDGAPILLAPEREVPPGTRVS